MSAIGTANNSNSVLIMDDYLSRLKDSRTADTGRAANPGVAMAAPSVSPAIPIDYQAGIQLTGAKDQEFRPYDATGLPKKINADIDTDSDGRAGKTGSQDSSNSIAKDSQQTKSSESQPGVSGEKKEDDPQVQQAVAQLRSIEEKVKAHEAAHKAAGGAITGPVSYSYTRGPDGRNYITGGEVPINVSSGRTPRETINRIQQVIQAALAPADPSPQDRAVAAQATTAAQNARQQEAEAESQAGEAADAAGASGVDAVASQANSQISKQQDSSEGDGRVKGKSGSGSPAPSFRPDAASGFMVVGEGRAASRGAGGGLMGRISRQAYSDPSVAGSNETNVKYSIATRQNDLRNTAGENIASGNASSRAGALDPAQLTGFGPARVVSINA